MQTFLSKTFKDTPEGSEADEILRSCVHCGFCNATCPTYQILGDERDGPRGRIYLIKEMLENNTASRETQRHLDRCLTCLACETTCPSGVKYSRLLEIGRAAVESLVARPLNEKIKREALLNTVPEPGRIRLLLKLADRVSPLLPTEYRKAMPVVESAAAWPATVHQRKVLLLTGCAQSVTAPRINLAAARVLDRLGVQALPADGCCGALSHHLSKLERTRATLRKNIDAWWPAIEGGVEALLLTASGCAPTTLDYGRLLQQDPEYADKAAKISSIAQDISMFLENEDLQLPAGSSASEAPIAYHSPCSLQHGLKRAGRVEALLTRLGFKLTAVQDEHLCCGSAGSYSILQKDLSQQLLERKLTCLEKEQPALIATANIGCQMHLQSRTTLPVKHWIELLE
jgi:glycolate oxidase iron-sulfur subunit